MGRHKHPSGDRALIAGRIPVDYDRKLKIYTKQTGRTRSDLVEELVTAFLDQHDPEQASGQMKVELHDLEKAS